MLALAHFGLSYDEFKEITPYELRRALRLKFRYDADLVEANTRMICDAIRMEAYHLVNIELPRGKKLRSPRQLMRFYWDNKQKVQTAEEMKAVMKAIAAYHGVRRSS